MNPYAADADRVTLVVNGDTITVSARHPHLLHALREELEITSPKDGCSPQGQCGCCTVLIDGKASISCQMPLARVAGKSITTLEGFPDAEVETFADTFAACGALQCGFCTPGIVVRAKALIEGRLAPSIDDVVALAEPSLKHRMALSFAARAEGRDLATHIAQLSAAME